ncbi:MFS transporter [Paraburkholderia silvatlantica]|uniref:MFS family permease n=1 Tax=Paraburkholderia silvatlantica TaxID=321895 RepID=A0ABR6FL77_9BURK|nr:MFS transporter [Paraburkholderia silvatlantica]MBB2928190.1 MFS family permease [Paraburkholderia silvatlantica]PVY31144.1 sugar phosphate permease [Paraburkholderia silvatlantica]PXW37281.1 sugar phosphate permease [Paraburkholderia silvatlantica]TDQ77480.1 sugar phosphate permease [Paraburkholderia silvatlantica]
MRRTLPKATTLVLAMLCLMYFITYVDRVNISTAAGQFKSELGLTNTQLGIIFSAFAYPYVIFQFIGGWVSDRFGARRTLIACAAVWAIATALTGLASGFVSLVAARLLLGLGEGATFPASTSAMAAWVTKDRRGMAQGITHSCARLGNAIAPIVVLALMTAFNWRFSFYLLGALSAVWLVLWRLTYTERPADHPRITREELAALPPPKTQSVDARGTWIRLYRRMAPVSAVYFCYNWILWLMLDWMPLYFMHTFHFNIKKAVVFTSGVFIAGVVGDLAGGLVSDRLIRRTGNVKLARSYLVALCMGLTAISLVPVVLLHDPMYSLACLAAAMFFNEMNIGPMWAIPMDIAYDRSGTASGIMSGTGFIAAIVSPVVAGYFVDRLGNWNMTFVLSIGVMMCGIALTFVMKPGITFDGGQKSTMRGIAEPSPS